MATPPIVDRYEEKHDTTGQENLLEMSIRKELATMISHGGIYTREAVKTQSSHPKRVLLNCRDTSLKKTMIRETVPTAIDWPTCES